MDTRNTRRAFTLTELTVVMAVLAIVLVLVTSFTAMVSNSRELSAARLEALQDIRVAEKIIENFIEGNNGVSIENSTLKVVTSTLTFYEGDTLIAGESKLAFDEREKALCLNGKAILTLKRVESIKFEFAKYGSSDDNADKIYYCRINYTVGDHGYDYTFCVYAGNGGTDAQE